MHRAVAAPVRQVVLFRQGQGVHVRAQDHRRAGVLTAQNGDHRGRGVPCGHLQWKTLERCQDSRLRLREVQSHLRQLVQLASQGHQVVGDGLGVRRQALVVRGRSCRVLQVVRAGHGCSSGRGQEARPSCPTVKGAPRDSPDPVRGQATGVEWRRTPQGRGRPRGHARAMRLSCGTPAHRRAPRGHARAMRLSAVRGQHVAPWRRRVKVMVATPRASRVVVWL